MLERNEFKTLEVSWSLSIISSLYITVTFLVDVTLSEKKGLMVL